jgi:hypothetical protein
MNLPSQYSNSGEKIVTINGNLFVRLIQTVASIISPPFFLYMKPNGTRFIPPLAIKTGMNPGNQQWEHAKTHWTDAKVEVLTEVELAQAVNLMKEIRKNFYFGFTAEQLQQRQDIIKRVVK